MNSIFSGENKKIWIQNENNMHRPTHVESENCLLLRGRSLPRVDTQPSRLPTVKSLTTVDTLLQFLRAEESSPGGQAARSEYGLVPLSLLAPTLVKLTLTQEELDRDVCYFSSRILPLLTTSQLAGGQREPVLPSCQILDLVLHRLERSFSSSVDRETIRGIRSGLSQCFKRVMKSHLARQTGLSELESRSRRGHFPDSAQPKLQEGRQRKPHATATGLEAWICMPLWSDCYPGPNAQSTVRSATLNNLPRYQDGEESVAVFSKLSLHECLSALAGHTTREYQQGGFGQSFTVAAVVQFAAAEDEVNVEELSSSPPCWSLASVTTATE